MCHIFSSFLFDQCIIGVDMSSYYIPVPIRLFFSCFFQPKELLFLYFLLSFLYVFNMGGFELLPNEQVYFPVML